MYKFIDLFCGIGGFRIALERQGLECVMSCDIDTYSRDVYEKNFNERPLGDITEIPNKAIPKHDVLCAGFPCQSFSISGKQTGMGSPRGQLFYEIIRIAEHHQPSIIILENVKNIVSIDAGKTIKIIVDNLSKIGYDVQYHILNSSYYGMPQARERVYFVCIRRDLAHKITYEKPQETMEAIFLENVLEVVADKKLFIDRDDVQLKPKAKNDQYLLKPIKIGIVNKGGQGERIYSPRGHAITLSASGGGAGARTGLYHTKDGIRKLSIKECKALMGFPVEHIVSDGIQGYKQLGNAVIPSMVERVWRNIKVL